MFLIPQPSYYLPYSPFNNNRNCFSLEADVLEVLLNANEDIDSPLKQSVSFLPTPPLSVPPWLRLLWKPANQTGKNKRTLTSLFNWSHVCKQSKPTSLNLHNTSSVTFKHLKHRLLKLNTCVCIRPSGVSCCVNWMLVCLRLSSKRKDSEPGTKSLLGNAEMMAHNPTDPVEMRRINFQTPGTTPAVC